MLTIMTLFHWSALPWATRESYQLWPFPLRYLFELALKHILFLCRQEEERNLHIYTGRKREMKKWKASRKAQISMKIPSAFFKNTLETIFVHHPTCLWAVPQEVLYDEELEQLRRTEWHMLCHVPLLLWTNQEYVMETVHQPGFDRGSMVRGKSMRAGVQDMTWVTFPSQALLTLWSCLTFPPSQIRKYYI